MEIWCHFSSFISCLLDACTLFLRVCVCVKLVLTGGRHEQVGEVIPVLSFLLPVPHWLCPHCFCGGCFFLVTSWWLLVTGCELVGKQECSVFQCKVLPSLGSKVKVSLEELGMSRTPDGNSILVEGCCYM